MIIQDYTDPEYQSNALLAMQANLLSLVQSYNPAATALRALRPEDFVGGTPYAYGSSIAAGSTAVITNNVSQGQGILFVGYASMTSSGGAADFGVTGAISVFINNVKRMEVPSCVIAAHKDRKAVQPENVMFARQNDRIIFQVNNGTGGAVSAVVWPMAYICAPPDQLQMK